MPRGKLRCWECDRIIDREDLIYCEKCGVPLHEWCAVTDELSISLCSSCEEEVNEAVERTREEFQEYLNELSEKGGNI